VRRVLWLCLPTYITFPFSEGGRISPFFPWPTWFRHLSPFTHVYVRFLWSWDSLCTILLFPTVNGTILYHSWFAFAVVLRAEPALGFLLCMALTWLYVSSVQLQVGITIWSKAVFRCMLFYRNDARELRAFNLVFLYLLPYLLIHPYTCTEHVYTCALYVFLIRISFFLFSYVCKYIV